MAEECRPQNVSLLLAPEHQLPQQIPAASGDFCFPESGKGAERVEFLQQFADRGFAIAPSNEGIDFIGLQTPLDRRSGLPLPIVAVDPPRRHLVDQRWDFHHNFHPEKMTLSSEGLRAVRLSRGQDLPRWLHEHYHKFFAGPQLPGTTKEQFMTCVMACAGVIPHDVIDLSGRSGPRVRRASRSEYGSLIKNVHYENKTKKDGGQRQRDKIGKFFANYALEQNIRSVVSDSVIDQFMHSPDKRLRRRLGNKMLKAAMNVAVDPVRPLYQDVRHRGMMSGNLSDPWKVVARYFVERRLSDYHDALYDRLLMA